MTEFERGQFDALRIISSAWHGKQYYFLENEERGIVYSRDSCRYMTLNDALTEFAERMWND